MKTKRKVIIIDDKTADSELLKNTLQALHLWEVNIKIVSSGNDAFMVFNKMKPDIIFIEDNLKNESGIDLIQTLRMSGSKVSMVLLSGHGSEEVVTKAFRAGADDYLNKNAISTESVDRILRYLTEKQTSRIKLRQAETKLKRIIQNTSTGLTETTHTGVVLDTNKAFMKMTGVQNRKNILGVKIHDFIAPESLDSFTKAFEKCLSGGQISDLEVILIQKDTQKRIYLLINATLEETTDGQHISALYRDITDRKLADLTIRKNELSLKRAQKLAKMGNWEFDIESQSFSWSDEMYRIFEVDPENTLEDLSTYYEACIHEDYIEKVKEASQRAMSSGNIQTIEYKISLPGNIEKYVKDERTYIIDKFDSKPKLIGIIQDITEQKNVEEALKDAKQKAEESDRLKTAFLANMSHEIRTPMNAIIGFTNLLSFPDVTPEKKQEYIDKINKSSEILLHLIDDIIDISKIEAQQVHIHYQPCFINKIMHELYITYDEEKHRLNKPEVDLRLSRENNDSGFIIYSDPSRLKQIMSNLIANAIKFTDKGYVEFGYNTLATPGYIRFYVKDTGIGIDKKQRDYIFDRFWKGINAKTKLYRGTGIGLTISKKLTELLNGKIWVESSTDSGSIFYLELPLKKSIEKQRESSVQIPDTKILNWHDKTILIAEDEELNYMYLEEALRKTKAQIIWAKDGKEAVEKFSQPSQKAIDLVLMDIKMPEMNGYDATRKIKQHNPKTPVIAQTAYAMTGEKELILDAGCDDYISKPVKVKKLLNTIKKYL